MKNFALIGAGGYVAPRHLKAIKDTGNKLLAALDKHDSVGILDSYFPQADFFVEFERFDRHLEKLKRQGIYTDYITVCSPNYLHDSHIRFGLKLGSDVICEKPLVLNPWNVDALSDIERETGKKVFTIMQLRLHPAVVALKERIAGERGSKNHNIDLQYITARGNWYQTSWKGDMLKSGGIATNIGIHFFDILLWIFGEVEKCTVKRHTSTFAEGVLILERATVNWLLSIDERMLPPHYVVQEKRALRSLIIDGETVDFNEGFNDLHTRSYTEILEGRGFSISDARKSIELVHNIRSMTL